MEPSSAEAGTSGEAALDQSVEAGSEGADLDTAIAVIASYSPAEIVLRYALQPEPMPPQSEEREDFDSAIGFVDVSGFTALSEKLKKDETQLGLGSELLNRCASRVIRSDAPPPAAHWPPSFRRSTAATAASCSPNDSFRALNHQLTRRLLREGGDAGRPGPAAWSTAPTSSSGSTSAGSRRP